MDKALEERLRHAIQENVITVSCGKRVIIDLSDAKRLLYRLKKENSKGNELVYKERKKS